jgi:molybdenum storage protein
VAELRKENLPTLPFDEMLLEVLETAQQTREFQLVDGRNPENIARAVKGEHVGTMVYADQN